MLDLNLKHRARIVAGESIRPAVVLVHGLFGDENSMWAFENVLPEQVHAVSMRAPLDTGNGFSWFNVSPLSGDTGASEDSFNAALSALSDFVRQLPRVYPIDEQRLLLVGFSQGAAVSYGLLLSEPHLATGMAALAGFLPKPARRWLTPARLTGKSVFIAHGLEDATLPIEEAVAAREAMLLAGAQISYNEYAVGHKMTLQGLRDLKAWLKQVV